jgi:hypothetical protein
MLMTLIFPMFILTKNALYVKSAAVVAVIMKICIGYARVALPKRTWTWMTRGASGCALTTTTRKRKTN